MLSSQRSFILLENSLSERGFIAFFFSVMKFVVARWMNEFLFLSTHLLFRAALLARAHNQIHVGGGCGRRIYLLASSIC